jgi:hypothetical protein
MLFADLRQSNPLIKPLISGSVEDGAIPLPPWTPGHRLHTMNAKAYAITTCDDPIRCPKPWTPVDSGYVMDEIGMVQNCRQPDNCRTQDPLRQLALPIRQGLIISRESIAYRAFLWPNVPRRHPL